MSYRQYEVTLRVGYGGLLSAAADYIMQYLTGFVQLANLDITVEGIKEVTP